MELRSSKGEDSRVRAWLKRGVTRIVESVEERSGEGLGHRGVKQGLFGRQGRFLGEDTEEDRRCVWMMLFTVGCGSALGVFGVPGGHP